MRIALLTLVLLLSGPAVAAAAPRLSLEVTPARGLVAGAEHRVAGTLTDGGAPIAGQTVTLEAQPAGEEAFAVLGAVATGPQGEYRFAPEFDRNTDVRVSTAGAAVVERRAFVFPDPRLTTRTERGRLVRLTQSFRARDADVRARTRFYLGRRGASRGRYVASARIRRVATGRFRVSVLARVPKAYGGRFSFGACIEAQAGSELGRPGLRCPRRVLRY